MIEHGFDFFYSRVEEEQEEGGVQYVGVCVCVNISRYGFVIIGYSHRWACVTCSVFSFPKAKRSSQCRLKETNEPTNDRYSELASKPPPSPPAGCLAAGHVLTACSRYL